MKKHLSLLALLLGLLTFGACEKALLTEDDDKTETPTTPSDDDEDNSGSGTDDSGDTGSDSGTNDNDSTGYAEPGTKDAEETDIIDGNEKSDDKEQSGTSGLKIGNEQAYTITEFLNKSFNNAVWVVGYVVGDCTKKHENANYNPPFSQPQAILIADDTLNIDESVVMSVKLSSQSNKDAYSLASKSDKYHKRIAVCGYRGKNYLGFSSFSYPLSAIQWYD